MKKYQKKFVILLFIFIFKLNGNVHADIIPDGMKSIHWCYELSNLHNYPEYTFLYQTNFSDAYIVIPEDDSCFNFYLFAYTKIYAIKSDTLSRAFYFPDDLGELNQSIISSKSDLYGLGGSVPLSDPLIGVKIFLEIVTIDDVSLEINKNSISYFYDDGMEEILPIINQETIPERSRSYQGSAISEILWYVLLPISALAGIFFLLVFKKRKK